MSFSSILDRDVVATACQRQRCRTRLAELRLARGRALDELMELCRNVQSNPAGHDPERMSYVVAEVRYLEARSEQLERFLALSGGDRENDEDF